MNKLAIALAALASFGVVTTAGAAEKQVKPSEWTCKELTETDIDVVPLVYWIDGYNSHGDKVVEMREDWFAVPVDEIVDMCKKNPR